MKQKKTAAYTMHRPAAETMNRLCTSVPSFLHNKCAEVELYRKTRAMQHITALYTRRKCKRNMSLSMHAMPVNPATAVKVSLAVPRIAAMTLQRSSRYGK